MNIPLEHDSFFLPGKRPEGVLVLHGLTSTPAAVRIICNPLNYSGLFVLGPRLPGHATNPEDMKNYSWKDWLEATQKAYVYLQRYCSKIHMIGFSMGANLAFCLSVIPEYPVEKIVSIGIPMKLYQDWYIRFGTAVYSLFSDYYQKPSTPRHMMFYNSTGTYTVWPYKGIKEMFRGIEVTKKVLPNVTSETLFISSKEDPIIDKRSSIIASNMMTLNDSKKHAYVVDDRSHLPTHGLHRDTVIETIQNFLDGNLDEKQLHL